MSPSTPTTTLPLLLLITLTITISTSLAITLQCHFHDSNWGYKCTDNHLTIKSRDNRTLTDIEGEHNEGKHSEVVISFSAYKNSIFYMPRELGGFFINLKYISIKSCGLRELTCRDLEQFGERLTYLWLCNNNIEFIERNLFKNNPNLALLNLIGNKLKFVETGAITELAYPHSLYLGGNPCYSGQITYDEEGIADFMADVESKCTFRSSFLGELTELREKNEDLNLKLKKTLKEVENLTNKLSNCERSFVEHSGDQESSV